MTATQNLNDLSNVSELDSNNQSLKKNNMKQKTKSVILIVFLFVVMIGVASLIFIKARNKAIEGDALLLSQSETEIIGIKPKGIMILIEYKDTVGLVNFVNEMQQRKIPALLHVSADFVEANCDTVKKLLDYDIEIMGSVAGQPLWDMSYEDQKQTISEMIETIETCTNTPVKIISSPYMASDMTTLAVAQELGIPYITARGTTDTKASVYQVEGYTTKILSVSNIPKVQFKYGSLCDFSYYQRAGSPEDMLAELMRAIEPLTAKEQARYGSSHKVTPVTHTNIGGYLQPWTEMWLNFWDSTTDKIDWISLDAFMSNVDWTLPDWQVPINKNAPYTPEKIRPATPYEEVEKVQNPCQVEDISSKTEELTDNEQVDQEVSQKNELVMFHNAKGPMCLAALDFFSDYSIEYTQYLNTEENYSQLLDSYRQNYPNSEGESTDYQYFPIIFYENKAYSGFNEKIQNEILNNWQTVN